MDEPKEVYYIIIGSIVFLGIALVTALIFVALAVYKHLKKKNLIKELYGEKERKNGQAKGGSHGRW